MIEINKKTKSIIINNKLQNRIYNIKCNIMVTWPIM